MLPYVFGPFSQSVLLAATLLSLETETFAQKAPRVAHVFASLQPAALSVQHKVPFRYFLTFGAPRQFGMSQSKGLASKCLVGLVRKGGCAAGRLIRV